LHQSSILKIRSRSFGCSINRKIARFFILLPFDLFITENDIWPTLDIESTDYRIKIHPPSLYADRPRATGNRLEQGLGELRPARSTTA
jgi:hypothetical protein